jgi:hypothetical protein
MMQAADGSSAFGLSESSETFQAKILGVVDLWRVQQLRHVACMKINIEGAEYDLLEAMVAADLIRDVDVFLIQFHPNVPDFQRRRNSIHEALAVSHANDLNYPFIWGRWVRKPGKSPTEASSRDQENRADRSRVV